MNPRQSAEKADALVSDLTAAMDPGAYKETIEELQEQLSARLEALRDEHPELWE